MSAARVPRIDALRGLAVFGIMLVNIWGFVYGWQLMTYPAPDGQLAFIDKAAIFFSAAFAEQKFYPIFSFLFGAGFALQTGGARRPGPELSAIEQQYRRRLNWLLACGLLHALLLWFGDILVMYAITGFWLALRIGERPARLFVSLKKVIWVNVALVAFTTLLYVSDESTTGQVADHLEAIARDHAVYTTGTWLEILKLRLSDFAATAANLIFVLPRVALLFLLGALAARSGLLRYPERHRAFWRRVLVIGLVIGVPLNLAWGVAAVDSTLNDGTRSMVARILAAAMEVAGPLMASGYVAIFMLSGPRVARILEPVGRMALTNYLMQSLLMVLILQGQGLGMGAHLSRAGLIGVAVAIMLFQLGFSHWWLSRHDQGPMEKLWRSYTRKKRANA